jgi:hypothetical protein
MTTFVKAPDVAGSSDLKISFNTDVLFHTQSSSTPAQLSSLTMSGFEDYQMTWFGLAVAGNTSTITSTSFQTNIDNTGMQEAFSSSAQGVDWDLLLSKSQTKNNVPTTDSRLGAIIETDYFTFNFVTASTLSEAYKEVWTDGKLANDPTDPNYNAFNHTNSLDFTNAPVGQGGHIYNDDVTNVLFVAFWGPGRYVREAAKRFQIRPTSNQTQEFILQACIRTETDDTVFSDIVRLREATTGLPEVGGDTFYFNQGEDTEWIIQDWHTDINTNMINALVYPHTAMVQLSYPRPIKFEDKDDTTSFAFIYEGMKINALQDGFLTPSKAYSNNTAEIAYDYITNKRYGLGEYLPGLSTSAGLVDHEQTNYLRYMLKEAKDRCNESLTITDSVGTTSSQSRYTFNSVLDQDSNKFETLSKILNNMHAKYYIHNGYFKIYQDKPTDVVKVVNQSNCNDIKFTGRNHLPEINTCYVKYNNETKMFKQDIAFAELRDQLNTGMPVVSKEVIMQGITNKYQAERHARYLVETARSEKEFVEYTAGADHVYNKPGDLIYFTHTEDDGKKHSGRIVSVLGNVVTIDANLDLDISKTYDVYIDNAVNSSTTTITPFNQLLYNNAVFKTTGTVSVATTNQITLTTTVGLENINADNTSLTAYNGQVINLVEQSTAPTESYQQEKQYKIQSITEIAPFQYRVIAQRYNRVFNIGATSVTNVGGGNVWDVVDDGYVDSVDFDVTLPSSYKEDIL